MNVKAVILPMSGIHGLVQQSDTYNLECYGIKLDYIIACLLDVSARVPISHYVMDIDELTPFIDTPYLQSQYFHYSQISPVKLNFEVVYAIFKRVLGFMYIGLQEYLFQLTGHLRNLNALTFTISKLLGVSDGLYIEFTYDYLPF